MRRTVALFCCGVVGLEILIGVPLAVCVGFLVVAQEGAGPLSVGPTYYASPGTLPAYDPYAPSAGAPTFSSPAALPPPVPMSYVGPAAPPLGSAPPPTDEPTSPASAAVLESRREIGSPLAGTSLETHSSSEPPDQAFTAAFEKVAIEEPPPALESASSAAESDTFAPQEKGAAELPLLDALQLAVNRLYELSNHYEADGEFGRADAARQLARDIRQERDVIRRDFPGSAPPTAEPGEPVNSGATRAPVCPGTVPAPAPAAEIPVDDDGAN